MRILTLRSFIAAFTLTMLMQIQQLESMEVKKQVTYNNHDIQIYKFLSSISQDSQFWLPTEIIRHIVINTPTIPEFLSGLKLDNCNNFEGIMSTTQTLNKLYHISSSLPAVLLKIYLDKNKISLLKISYEGGMGPWGHPTLFDCFGHTEVYDLMFKTWCQVVDKKAFVDHFKQCNGYKGTRLHSFIECGFRVEIMETFFCVFLDYAGNCSKKSEEVLNVLKAKNYNEKTALDLAQNAGKFKMAALIESTIKKLKQNLPKQENCLIQ